MESVDLIETRIQREVFGELVDASPEGFHVGILACCECGSDDVGDLFVFLVAEAAGGEGAGADAQTGSHACRTRIERNGVAVDGDAAGGEQILALLDSGDVDALRAEAAAVWNANYCDDGAVTSILANSLWLSDKISFKQETMDALAKYDYASSFRGEMGSAAFDKALQDWIDQQTGGLLKEQASGLTMDQETILALASTIYFRAKWDGEFSEANTAPDTFHADSGDTACDFMRQRGTNTYYWSDRFSAVSKRLEGSGAMWFLLPDEGVTPEELLADEPTMDFLLSDGESAESKYLIVNLALPKFDTASDLDLADSLKALGITDVFDPAVSDFSPMTDDTAAYLSQAKHAARVTVDEEGVTAAAYTVMMTCGAAAPPEEEVDFVLNRPFVFAITGTDGLPLFAGIVHQPQP